MEYLVITLPLLYFLVLDVECSGLALKNYVMCVFSDVYMF